MSQYRKKPIVIEAYQTTYAQTISTLEGVMLAMPGDWIITGVNGERYPCKPDIFEKSYEPASQPSGAVVLSPEQVAQVRAALEEIRKLQPEDMEQAEALLPVAWAARLALCGMAADKVLALLAAPAKGERDDEQRP